MSKIKIKQTGFTLVELLVAIVLGLLLTAAIIQSYLGTKRTFSLNDGISRIQESARFSFYFLSRDIRNAGDSSCLSRIRNKIDGDADVFVSHIAPVFGWNANGSQTGSTVTLTGTTGAVSNWTGFTANLPTQLTGRVISGSDVLSFKAFEKLDVKISSGTTNNEVLTTAGNHDLEAGSVLVAGNCWQADLFQNTLAGGNQLSGETGAQTPGNRALASATAAKWEDNYGPEDSVFALQRTIYYIGEGSGRDINGNALPSLFRYQTSQATIPTITAGNSQELVEGVESMQVLYGVDTNADLSPNNYVSANQVGDFNNVVSVRVGLLLRSTNNVTDSDTTRTDDYTLLDEITITHPDDRILRYAVNTTIKLRNRALTAGLETFSCDVTADTDDTPDCT